MIQIIRTNKTIVYIVKSLYLVGVVHLHVSCPSVTYLEVSSLAYLTANGLILARGGSGFWYVIFGELLN